MAEIKKILGPSTQTVSSTNANSPTQENKDTNKNRVSNHLFQSISFMPYWLRGMPAPSNPGGQQVVQQESSEHIDALYDEPEVSGQQALPPPTTTATTTNVSPPPPTVATAQTNMATPQRLHVTCGKFDPVVDEDPHMFWQLFIKFVALLNLTERQMLDYLPFYLEGVAKEWFFQLSETIKSNLTRVKDAFLERFSPNTPFNLEVWELNQGENETVENFIHRVKRSARKFTNSRGFLNGENDARPDEGNRSYSNAAKTVRHGGSPAEGDHRGDYTKHYEIETGHFSKGNGRGQCYVCADDGNGIFYERRYSRHE